MIVSRYTINVRRGRMEEAVALFKELDALYPDITSRVYVGGLGVPDDTIVHELEHESLAAREQWEADWTARPEFESMYTRYRELTEGHNLQQIYELR